MALGNKQWIPLESNPEVLTTFSHALGLPFTTSFTDVWSLDLLDMVPTPRHAILLLFPITPRIRAAIDDPTPPNPSTDSEAQQPANSGSGGGERRGEDTEEEKPFFCRQTIGNACGTIALLHAALNCDVSLREDSFLHNFQQQAANLSPMERADRLHADDALDRVHTRFAYEGQTAVPSADEKIDMHFVCFAHRGGKLYELDGRRESPVVHGATTKDNLLHDAATVIKDKFMAADPNEHRFTIVALTDDAS